MIQAYYTRVKLEFDRIASANFVLNAVINFETRPGDQAFIHGYVVFMDESRLFFREYLDATAAKAENLMYSYHYQTTDDKLVFRYDNARHKPTLPFVEHKHLPSSQIQQAEPPTIPDVLKEVAIQRNWI